MNSAIRILHVDDDPDFVDMAATLLEREDDRFEVETATSATDGFDRLTTHSFDCVVSDYEMPGQNGIEFLQTVREEYPDLPFILFTGKGSEEVASDAIAAGVTDYLQKGADTSQYTILTNRIINAVQQYQAQTELQARERRFEALLQYSPDRLFILDEDGHYQFVSPAMERILGYHPEEMERKHRNQFVHPDDQKKVAEAHQQLLDNPDETLTLEYRVQHKDGTWRWVESRGRNRLDDSTINGLIINSRDITDRKQREQQLQRERDRFQSLFETLPEPAILVSGNKRIDATITRVNQAFENTFGYEEQDIVGEDINDVIVPPDRRDEAERIDHRNVEGELPPTEVRRQTKDGELRDFLLLTTQLIAPDEATPYEGFAIYTDITDRREQADRLNALANAFPDIAFIIDEDGRHIEQLSNPSSENLLVTQPDDIIGSRLHDLFPSEQADEFLSIIEQTITTGDQQRIEYEIDTNDGGHWFESRITPYPSTINDKQAVVWVARDITKRKHRERELEQYQTIVESAPDPIAVVDPDGHFEYVNPAFTRLTEYDEKTVLGKHFSLIKPDQEADRTEEALNRLMTTDEMTTVRSETLLETTSDRSIICEDHMAAVSNGEDPRGGVIIHRDVTERVVREEQVERERDRFTTLFENLPVPVVHGELVDGEPIIRTVNRQFEQVFGYDAAKAANENLDDLTAPSDHEDEAVALNQELIENGRLHQEVRRQTADGIRDFDLRVVLRMESDPPEGYAIYTDITERKERERKLKRQNERLDEFASVVSHDLRNPLNVAQGHLELVQKECDSEYLGPIDRALDRMETLIDDLLTLAREGEPVTDFEPIDLEELLTGCWQTIATEKAALTIRTNHPIEGDESRLQQLFENLFRNAVEHGGEDVTVTVGQLDTENGFYIADDGPGIPTDKREQIFESGYSTTETGTGFGLAIINEIVEAHGWEITVTNGDDGGARFEITGVEFADE